VFKLKAAHRLDSINVELYMFRASSVLIIRGYLLYARQFVHFMQAM